MAECDCGHAHEEITIVVPGSTYGQSKKWRDYRVEIEAIVVKTYASLDERRADRRPVYGGPLWENPSNPLQLIRPLEWRARYTWTVVDEENPKLEWNPVSRSFAQATYHGAASIQGVRMDHPESPAVEFAVFRGLELLRHVKARRGAPLGSHAKPGDHQAAFAAILRVARQIENPTQKKVCERLSGFGITDDRSLRRLLAAMRKKWKEDVLGSL